MACFRPIFLLKIELISSYNYLILSFLPRRTKMLKTDISLLLLLALVACSTASSNRDWNVEINSQCTQNDPVTNHCMRWQTNGKLEKEDVCFWGQSQVQVFRNRKTTNTTIKELEIGDLVWGRDANGNDAYVKILTWLHRNVTGRTMFYKITTSDDLVLEVTGNHMVWVNGIYREARNLRVGNLMKNFRGQEVSIKEITTFHGNGYYNPLLSGDGTIYVNGLLSHTLTDIEDIKFLAPEWAFIALQYFATMTSNKSQASEDQHTNAFVDMIHSTAIALGIKSPPKETYFKIEYQLTKIVQETEKTKPLYDMAITSFDATFLGRKISNSTHFAKVSQNEVDKEDKENEYLPMSSIRQVRSLGVEQSSSYNNNNNYNSNNGNNNNEQDAEDENIARGLVSIIMSVLQQTLFTQYELNRLIPTEISTTIATTSTPSPTTTTSTLT